MYNDIDFIDSLILLLLYMMYYLVVVAGILYYSVIFCDISLLLRSIAALFRQFIKLIFL